ncbi:hypothetical protein CROQUDRAFT_111749 [Cronartium quercuum f. sp. fusiforme G11]|uniref:Secreted protein n=1 Tax=Cronartium quercuum f. sp. fusiforme G11 TaxID=708437 RepID=A0A9P6T511_9BASI|nr:hypothetical protein CROQUDRAFT_111749 [Cronartium quercuum f. sp. fusiforme G11]
MRGVLKLVSLLVFASVSFAFENLKGPVVTCDWNAAHKQNIDFGECLQVLDKYRYEQGWIVDNKPENRKSCYGCQVVFETQDESNIVIPKDVARNAVRGILESCNGHAGATSITYRKGRNGYGSVVVAVRNGVGKQCDSGFW